MSRSSTRKPTIRCSGCEPESGATRTDGGKFIPWPACCTVQTAAVRCTFTAPEMEIARQEATVKMYAFRLNSEPENYAALTESYKEAEEKLEKLYARWDAIAEDM